MKLKFKNQEFQTDAVNVVADLFLGQEQLHSSFAIEMESANSMLETDYGIGNKLVVDTKTVAENMHAVQKRQSLPLTSDGLEDRDQRVEDNPNIYSLPSNLSFSIEMETGTGKTYVYTRTAYELNKRYGFTKFIIVVPSVAIREGVYKSLQVTNEHFANHYDNVPCRYFIYNSARLSDVRQFATSSNIEIMIINIDAFKKAENIINQAQDKLNGETAMRYICDTNPIVIIDEPQSVDNTDKAKEAIASLNPLCVLRYSATHRDKINLLYRLTPVDAYQMGLVKQIAVSSNQSVNDFNKPYIRLVSVSNDNGFSAKVEMDILDKKGKVARKTVTIKPDSDLFMKSGEREMYDDYKVSGIDCTVGFEAVEFTNGEIVRLGKAIGEIDENVLKRAQIRRTIEAHLSKELRYFSMGIKVLSLFFIDEVKKYRDQSLEGRDQGIYAQMFEECYIELINMPKFKELRKIFHGSEAPLPSNLYPLTPKIHDGYFSQDKKGKLKNTKGNTVADDDTYSLIMKDKERLLSFDSPLRFIFSHSALKEGWDNPNVFQVCTLIEQKSTFTARQKVGRGLRLCVNQEGERIEDKDINLLHVMANESFAEFADNLQKEIETETGVKFGVIDLSLFYGMVYEEKREVEKIVTTEQAEAIVEIFERLEDRGQRVEDIVLPAELESIKEVVIEMVQESKPIEVKTLSGANYTETIVEEKTMDYNDAQEVITHLTKKGYIDKKGKAKDTMKAALLEGNLDLPEKYKAATERFKSIIEKATTKPPLRDASRDVTVRINKQVMISPEFLELWNKIKQKTSYRVAVDTNILIGNSVADIAEMDKIVKARIISQTADVNIERAGVSYSETACSSMDLNEAYSSLPNIIGVISEKCLITRKTAAEILGQSDRIQDFLNNPQLFIERVIDIINYHRHKLAVNGIRYIKLDGEEYSVMEIFNQEELIANLDKNAVEVKNSVYDHIVYDSSTIEKPFALALDSDPNVKMFFKIPSRFKIDTPIGTYNPDWAVYIEQNGIKKLYFVLETKFTATFFDPTSNTTTKEEQKIYCGKQHFKALEEDIALRRTKSWNKFKVEI